MQHILRLCLSFSFSSKGWIGHSSGGILEEWIVCLLTEKSQYSARCTMSDVANL